jgi:hypothetical protein
LVTLYKEFAIQYPSLPAAGQMVRAITGRKTGEGSLNTISIEFSGYKKFFRSDDKGKRCSTRWRMPLSNRNFWRSFKRHKTVELGRTVWLGHEKSGIKPEQD